MTNDTISLTIDGTRMEVPAGTTIMEAAARLGYRHSKALLPSQAESGRFLPGLYRRRGRARLFGILQHRGMGRHASADQLTRDPPGAARYRRVAPGQPPHGLPDVRARRQLRVAEPGLLDGACVRGCSRASGSGFPCAIPAVRSSATRKSASSADDAYGYAPRSRACIISASRAAASRPWWGPAHLGEMDESVCIQCGQCINVCPTAAFLEKRSTDEVWQALADPEMHVVVQTAPSIRAAIGEGFDMPAGHAGHRTYGNGPATIGF